MKKKNKKLIDRFSWMRVWHYKMYKSLNDNAHDLALIHESSSIAYNNCAADLAHECGLASYVEFDRPTSVNSQLKERVA